MSMRHVWPLIASGILIAPAAVAEEIGSFTNDWSGNEIVVEAIEDPEIKGITCHVTHFERGMIDRLRKGNWFEDPSNASIACQQTAAMVIGDIERDEEGEEVFNERKSLVFKKLAVRRIYDAAHQALVYVVYSREVVEGSAKMDISTVPLHGAEVTWENDANQ
jgi:CreA protein